MLKYYDALHDSDAVFFFLWAGISCLAFTIAFNRSKKCQQSQTWKYNSQISVLDKKKNLLFLSHYFVCFIYETANRKVMETENVAFTTAEMDC